MAELVGAFASSHAPLIGRDWHLFPASMQQRLTKIFDELGRRVEKVNPDVIIEISPDHWINFFLNNLPGICIGVGEENDGPPEPFLKPFGHDVIEGDAALATHIVKTAFASDFEPSVSHRMTLDHGFCIPLWKMGLAKLPRIIPITFNDLEPPMPSLQRCAAFGQMLAKAIASYPGKERVAILASGGLSHSIGEPTMGAIYKEYDQHVIELFADGRQKELLAFLEANIGKGGNGAHEIRNWVAAHAAMGYKGFDLVDYVEVYEVYVGCGFASWNR